jgi:alpha-beta hydrolase superfamily lysophospholipase
LDAGDAPLTPVDAMEHQELELECPDRARLYARVWKPMGRAIGAVTIVHGIGEHSGRYQPLGEFLAAAGYLCLAYDQRGHGQTAGQRGHAADYQLLLGDIQTAIDAAARLAPCDRPFLLGQSFGGGLVLNLCIRRPPALAGVIACSPLLRMVTPPPLWKRCLGRMLSHLAPRFSFRTHLDPSALSHDPLAVQRYRNDPLVHHRVSARLAVQMLDAGRWVLGQADRLSVPSLLMHGQADTITDPQATCQFAQFAQRAGADCTFKIWPGLFHELHWEQEHLDVMRCLVEWLGRH